MSAEPNVSESRPTSPSIRLLRPSIVVLCGPAASGKTTFAERHFRPTQVISSDRARARVCDDERDQRFNTEAFRLVHFLIEQRLMLNRLCVVDSTALSATARRELLELARRFQVPAVAVLFDVSLETCVERDERRERSVGRDVVARHYQGFELAKSAIRQEGFDQVVELRDGDAEDAKIEIVFRPVVRVPQKTHKAAEGHRPPERPYPGSTARWSNATGPHSNAGVSSPPSGPAGARPAAPAMPLHPAPPKPDSTSMLAPVSVSLVESKVMGK